MSDKLARTFKIKPSTDEWIEEKAEEVNTSKSELVERAVRVYAMQIRKGKWNDPKWGDKIDRDFEGGRR